jgi:hypothetical protein
MLSRHRISVSQPARRWRPRIERRRHARDDDVQEAAERESRRETKAAAATFTSR